MLQRCEYSQKPERVAQVGNLRLRRHMKRQVNNFRYTVGLLTRLSARPITLYITDQLLHF